MSGFFRRSKWFFAGRRSNKFWVLWEEKRERERERRGVEFNYFTNNPCGFWHWISFSFQRWLSVTPTWMLTLQLVKVGFRRFVFVCFIVQNFHLCMKGLLNYGAVSREAQGTSFFKKKFFLVIIQSFFWSESAPWVSKLKCIN